MLTATSGQPDEPSDTAICPCCGNEVVLMSARPLTDEDKLLAIQEAEIIINEQRQMAD